MKNIIKIKKASKFETDRDLNISFMTVFDGSHEQGSTIGIKNEQIDTLIAKLIEFKNENNIE